MICDKCGQLPQFCDCPETDFEEAAAYFETLPDLQDHDWLDLYSNDWKGER